jgi:hypothetical protein
MRFSCSPWAADARRNAAASSVADANVVAPGLGRRDVGAELDRAAGAVR